MNGACVMSVSNERSLSHFVRSIVMVKGIKRVVYSSSSSRVRSSLVVVVVAKRLLAHASIQCSTSGCGMSAVGIGSSM